MQPKTLGPRLESVFVRPPFDPFRIPEPRLGDGKVCHIFRGFGRDTWLLSPDDPAAGGAAGAGAGAAGAAGGTPKTYTQEEHQAAIDAAIGKRLGEVNKKTAEEKKALADKIADLERGSTELQEKLDQVGKSKDEIERDNAAKAAKQIEKAVKEGAAREATLSTERDTWKNKFIGREVADQLGRALVDSKVLSTSLQDAILVLKSSAEIVHDDDGRITSITYEGVAYDSVSKAAMAFLKMKPHFASAGTPGGGGTRPPSGSGGAPNGRPLYEMSDEELQTMDASRRAARG